LDHGLMQGAMPMPLDKCFEEALRSPGPIEELRLLAVRFSAQGESQGQIIAKFEEVRRQLREASRDLDEDVVMDVMDCLIGWCSPQVRIPFQAGEFREEER
jgi:hypothetical protein